MVFLIKKTNKYIYLYIINNITGNTLLTQVLKKNNNADLHTLKFFSEKLQESGVKKIFFQKSHKQVFHGKITSIYQYIIKKNAKITQ